MVINLDRWLKVSIKSAGRRPEQSKVSIRPFGKIRQYSIEILFIF
jgi:hypothetical protein